MDHKTAKPETIVWDGVSTSVSVTLLEKLGQLAAVFEAWTWSFPNPNRMVIVPKPNQSMNEASSQLLNLKHPSYVCFYEDHFFPHREQMDRSKSFQFLFCLTTVQSLNCYATSASASSPSGKLLIWWHCGGASAPSEGDYAATHAELRSC